MCWGETILRLSLSCILIIAPGTGTDAESAAALKMTDPTLDESWESFDNSYYKFFIDSARKVDTTRNNAERICNSNSASLVSIQTNKELEWLKVKIQEQVAAIGEEFAHQQWWTSGKVDYGVWVWSDPKLTPVAITALRKRTPGKRDHDRFLAIAHGHDGWRLRGFPDNYKLRFICEKELPNSLSSWGISIEEKIIRYLSREHDVKRREFERPGEILDVKVSLSLKNIIELDESRQLLSSSALIQMEWEDNRLTWNATDFSNISRVYYKAGEMWVPDIHVANSVDDDHLQETQKTHLYVTSSGAVHWLPEGTFRTRCEMNLKRFPFDEQLCSIVLGTHSHYNMLVNLTSASDPDLSKFSPHNEWYIVGTSTRSSMEPEECCQRSQPRVIFQLHLRRRHTYYIINLVMPCALLSILLLGSLWLPYNTGEKLTSIIIILLAFTILLHMVSAMIPRSSNYLPILEIYLIAVMGIGTIGACSSILVISISHREPQQYSTKWTETLMKCLQQRSVVKNEDTIPMSTINEQYKERHKPKVPKAPCRRHYQHVQTGECETVVPNHVGVVGGQGPTRREPFGVEGQTNLDLEPDYGVIRKEVEAARSQENLNHRAASLDSVDLAKQVLDLIHRGVHDGSNRYSGSSGERHVTFKDDVRPGSKARKPGMSGVTSYKLAKTIDRIISIVLTVLTIAIAVILGCFAL